MAGEGLAQRIDPRADRCLGGLRWRALSGGALLVLAVLAGLTFGGVPAEGAFPGINGKLFCQEASASKATNVFSINPDGSARTLVTNTTFIDPANPDSGFSNNLFPRVSPDGKKLLFASNRDGVLSIYVMNADGSGPATRLTFPVAPAQGDLFSAWSPDGGKIFFTRLFPGGDGEIFSMNADGSNPVNLTNRATQEVGAAVSPDGRKVLFHSDRNFAPTTARDFDIYSMNTDGSDVRNITNNSGPDAVDLFPNWSPDGRQIVFESAQNDGSSRFAFSNIYKMNADGTGLTQLTFATSGLNRFPVWSPDGTRISFDSIRDTPPAPEPQNREVYTMKTDGSDVRRVTNAPGSDSTCDWQTIPRPAVVPPPTYPQPPVTPAAGKLKTTLTLKAKPRRDRRLPFRYRFTGRVRIPAGVSKAAVCGGRVKLRLKKGAKTVARGTAKVSKSCTYKKRITIKNTRRTGKKGKLKVAARFGGNARLKSSKKSTTVRFF